MKAIEKFSFFWRPEDDSGSLHMALEGGSAADIFIDNAAEASFLLSLMRHEKMCYYDSETRQISTGLEPVGAARDGDD